MATAAPTTEDLSDFPEWMPYALDEAGLAHTVHNATQFMAQLEKANDADGVETEAYPQPVPTPQQPQSTPSQNGLQWFWIWATTRPSTALEEWFWTGVLAVSLVPIMYGLTGLFMNTEPGTQVEVRDDPAPTENIRTYGQW